MKNTPIDSQNRRRVTDSRVSGDLLIEGESDIVDIYGTRTAKAIDWSRATRHARGLSSDHSIGRCLTSMSN
ncbi:hypothetical protein NTCA1_50610 [Novosphingobium sp. TCA1]|nr:hypothetical protein NTCA1_50610 [Novosphingobium sp. TCA1]